jgi:hypothetical protein
MTPAKIPSRGDLVQADPLNLLTLGPAGRLSALKLWHGKSAQAAGSSNKLSEFAGLLVARRFVIS